MGIIVGVREQFTRLHQRSLALAVMEKRKYSKAVISESDKLSLETMVSA